ncbi:hypothetical protein D3C77_545950 [compost metagenome]
MMRKAAVKALPVATKYRNHWRENSSESFRKNATLSRTPMATSQPRYILPSWLPIDLPRQDPYKPLPHRLIITTNALIITADG